MNWHILPIYKVMKPPNPSYFQKPKVAEEWAVSFKDT